MYRAVTDRFPNISTVRVKDAIAQVNGLLQQLADGVRAASLVTILAGLLVLAGAIAAGQRARLYDSTVLKVLGATRARIAGIYAMEYGLLGIVTGALALGAGTLAAWIVARKVFDVPFAFDLRAALLTVLGGGAATLLFGIAAAWTALSARPAISCATPDALPPGLNAPIIRVGSATVASRGGHHEFANSQQRTHCVAVHARRLHPGCRPCLQGEGAAQLRRRRRWRSSAIHRDGRCAR